MTEMYNFGKKLSKDGNKYYTNLEFRNQVWIQKWRNVDEGRNWLFKYLKNSKKY